MLAFLATPFRTSALNVSRDQFFLMPLGGGTEGDLSQARP